MIRLDALGLHAEGEVKGDGTRFYVEIDPADVRAGKFAEPSLQVELPRSVLSKEAAQELVGRRVEVAFYQERKGQWLARPQSVRAVLSPAMSLAAE